jgi:hypothetical protein
MMMRYDLQPLCYDLDQPIGQLRLVKPDGRSSDSRHERVHGVPEPAKQ